MLLALFSFGQKAHAVFNANLLLEDSELTDNHAMTKAGVLQFLRTKGSALANLVFESVGGIKKAAADIITDAGEYYGVSQKYLLVRLQVEQSLVTDVAPTQRQLDFAAGYGCPDSTGCDSQYKGFFNQVNWSAKTMQGAKYLGGIRATGRTISGWGPGITKRTLDNIEVTPANAATAALYTYTPWVGKYGGGDQRWGGSSLIWKKFNDWFARQFPDGSLLKESGKDNYYIIESGKKRLFRSLTVLTSSYDPRKALTATTAELAAYENGSPIVFPNYSLIRSPRGTIFLIVDGTKRGIASSEVFRTLGFNPEEVQNAPWDDINYYPDGAVINLESAYPAGALLRSATTGGIAYVENGVRHAIYAPEIFYSRFKGRPSITVTQEEIDGYAAGEPATFRDGELVSAQGAPSVYFISNGTKRPIVSRDAFDRLGFRWVNVIWTSQRALDIHPLGEPLDLPETE